MTDQNGNMIMIAIFAFVALALFIYVTLGRICGFYRTWHYVGGGKITLTAELSICVMAGSAAALMYFESAFWFITLVFAIFVQLVSGRVSKRKHETEEDEIRKRNAVNHPGIFDDPPPTDLDSIHGEELDLYDAGSCTYIGRAFKSDIKAIIDVFGFESDDEKNDIFVLEEIFVFMDESSLTEQFVEVVTPAFEKRDDLVLRWMPIPDVSS